MRKDALARSLDEKAHSECVGEEINGKRSRGTPKKPWNYAISKDMKEVGVAIGDIGLCPIALKNKYSGRCDVTNAKEKKKNDSYAVFDQCLKYPRLDNHS